MPSSDTPIHDALQESYQRDLANSILGTDNADEIESITQKLLQTSLEWVKPECFHFEISVGATFGFTDNNCRRCMLKVFGPDCIESELLSKRNTGHPGIEREAENSLHSLSENFNY